MLPHDVILRADENTGHDKQWTSRPYYSRRTWGIIGSGKKEQGNIWFDSFPGESGKYEVFIDAILEQDGSSHYALYLDDTEIARGRFPYPDGKRDCDARGRVGVVRLGTHHIEKGAKIKVWGQSVYECGEKGAYTLWYALRFTKVKSD